MSLARARIAAKLLLVAGLLVLGFATDLAGLALLLVAAEGLLLASGVRAQRVVLLAALATLPFALLNAVLYGDTTIAALGPIALRAEGLAAGLGFAGRAVLAVMAGLWVLATTPPREALRSLRRWPRAALAAAGTARFLPLAAEDWTRVREAQALRGRAIAAGLHGTLAAAPLTVPLMVATVRRGRTLQEAIEASAFGSGPRTAWPTQPWRATDAAAALLGLVLLGLAAWVALRGAP